MAGIRVERVPIKTFNLGLIGFDHLQLVYQQDDTDILGIQDGWFVMEGVREATPQGVRLGVDGWEGLTTLSAANGGAEGDDLAAKIGTPAARGTRLILADGDAAGAWQTMVSYAGDFEAQGFPYISFALPGSPIPTINSSSVVSSLLYYIGVDLSLHMPFGVRLSPGTTTLLGTTGDDELSIVNAITTIVGGEGRDTLAGGNEAGRIDKLYGGKDDDRFLWSSGFNILHGGEPELDYAKDGTDTVDYTGVGVVRIDANPHAVLHYRPDFIASFETGLDHLYSIEGIEWDERSDQVVLGKGVGLIEHPVTLKLGQQESDGEGDRIEFSEVADGLLINAAERELALVQAAARLESDAGVWVEGAEWLVGSAGDDRIYAGEHMRGVEGGDGADLIDARLAQPFTAASPRGFDIEADGGAGDDTIVSGAGRTIAKGGEGADRFVLSTMTFGADIVEFVIEDASAEDRAFAPYSFFFGDEANFEGSPLMPLLGAIAREPGTASFAALPENLGPWPGGPPARSDYFRFEWQLESDRHFGSDQTDGLISFSGAALYNREASDLLIHLFFGGPLEVTEEGSNGEPWTHTLNIFLPGTETIIRVKDFDDGDLGIQFFDPGTPAAIDIETDHGPYGVLAYPGWDGAVHALTNDGHFEPALEERPPAPVYDPEDSGPGSEQEVVRGTTGDDTITIATSADATIEAGAGNDTVAAGRGDDVIDGGEGLDRMTGGSGDDVYIVDSPGDAVIEAGHGGIDQVRSSVSYTLPAFVENLTLLGATSIATLNTAATVASDGAGAGPLAVTGIGNALANRLVGNEAANALWGLDGDDVLYGGAGNDVLDGGPGSDAYVYLAGDGDDIILDFGPQTDRDVLMLGAVAPLDVAVHRLTAAPGDLVLTLAEGGRLSIEGFSSAPGSGIDAIEFDDQTVWERGDIELRAAAAPLLSSDPPQARDDFDLAMRGSDALIPWTALTANDRDFDGDALAIVAIGEVSEGASVSIEPGGNLHLATAAGYEGPVSFSYEVSDGRGGSALAHAEIAVLQNHAPVATAPVPDQVATRGDPFSFALPAGLFRDSDGDGLTLTAGLAGGAALPDWLGFDAATRVLAGTPPPGFSGALDIAVTASDGLATTSTGFRLVADATNRAPVGTADHGLETLASVPLVIEPALLLGNDVDADGDTLEIASVHSPLNGTVALGPSGHIVFTPASGYSGPAWFMYTVSDGHAGTATALVDITIKAPSGRIILGTHRSEALEGRAAGDIIEGRGGNDALSGRGGDDVFIVAGRNEGFDRFDGGAGFDRIQGSAGDDVIGLANAAGNLRGIELIDGGEGYDVLRLAPGPDGLRLDLSRITLTGVELIDAGAGDDRVIGSSSGDTISGGRGDDRLSGGGGDDVFLVTGRNSGYDVLDGGSGFDSIRGGSGDDVIGLARVDGNLSGIEAIDGGAGFDVIRLTKGNDMLDLSRIAVTSIERIDAGAGNDRIVSGAGDDVVSGGAGNDTFQFRPGFGHDVITDFDTGTSLAPLKDVIDISDLGYRTLAELLADAEQSGPDTLVTIDADTSLTIANVAPAHLHADDFRFA